MSDQQYRLYQFTGAFNSSRIFESQELARAFALRASFQAIDEIQVVKNSLHTVRVRFSIASKAHAERRGCTRRISGGQLVKQRPLTRGELDTKNLSNQAPTTMTYSERPSALH
jgi:hypothetical protein